MAIYNLAWFVVVLPLVGAAASFLAETQRRAAQICVGFMGLAFVLALIVLGVRLTNASTAPFDGQITFFSMSPPEGSTFATRFEPFLGVHVDNLSAALAAAVAFVILMVQAYSLSWFRGEATYRRFFWTSSLFAFAILGFVLSPNTFHSLFMWTAASAALYLMSLHWTERPDAAAPARRVLVALRLGDVALMLGVVVAFIKFGTYASTLPAPAGQHINDPFSFTTINQATTGVLHGVVHGAGLRTLAVLACLFIFAAVVRAAQFPFHVWLAELAAAPVPVLALGTSVAGVLGPFLVARLYPIIVSVPHAPTALALVGGVTSLFAAAVAIAQRDVMRVAAFAAVLPLGLSMVALGTGGYSAAMFVLFTGVFFEALLVIASGNLVRVYRTRNIHEMGGAWPRMRLTVAALCVWALGIAGFNLATYYALSSVFVSATPTGAHISGTFRAALVVLVVLTAIGSVLFAGRLVLTVCAGSVARRRSFQPERVREVERPMLRWSVLAVVAAAGSVAVGLPGIHGGATSKGRFPSLTFVHFVFFGAAPSRTAVDAIALIICIAVGILGALTAWFLYAPVRRAVIERLVLRYEGYVRAVARGFFLERLAHRIGHPFVRGSEVAANFDRQVLDGATRPFIDAAALAEQAWVRRATWTRSDVAVAASVVVVAVLALLSVLAATGHFWVHTA
jgi:NADH-quinone oxidoreductase subunit L